MTTTTHRDDKANTTILSVAVTDQDMHALQTRIVDAVTERVVASVAELFLATHTNDVIAKIDQQAVATLAVATAAKAINRAVFGPDPHRGDDLLHGHALGRR